MALSTDLGEPNQPAGGGGGGPFITSGIHLVTDDLGQPVALTSSAYQEVARGDKITYNSRIKLFDVDRSFFSGTLGDNVLTAR